MENRRFLKGAERLVDPVTVGSTHFFQSLVAMTPKPLQRAMLEGASKKTPFMGFVVEPYAFFLFYRVTDEERADRLLPEDFKLARSRVFAGDDEACYAIVSVFRVHTSVFWGSRAEFYLVAEDERTGMLSWVIVDYLSDTIGYDRANGLRAPSAPGSVVTTSADGCVVADVRDIAGRRAVAFEAKLANGEMRPLDRRLWVEGNLSVAYGPALSPGDAGVFSLMFDDDQMAEALDVPPSDLRLERMTWHEDLLEDRPSKLACFPFAQHLLSDSPGSSSGMSSADELAAAVRAVDFDAIPRFSAASTRKAMLASSAVSLALIAALGVALAMKMRSTRLR